MASDGQQELLTQLGSGAIGAKPLSIVAVSASSVYRVLKAAGKLAPRTGTPSRKGKGFEQPLRPHEHWHVDVSYLNICGTFFFLCSILDGHSRFVVHWEIRETMKEAEVETIRSELASVPDEVPMMDAIRHAVVSANHYRAADVPEMRMRMNLFATVPALSSSAAEHYEAWERAIART